MHTKRIATGHGKEHKWIVTPRPGAHPKDESIPLLLIVRDMLHYADTAREAKFIINNGSILVDRKVRKDPKFGIGLMDLIEIPKEKKYFRAMPSKKGLTLKKIDREEANMKLCKLMKKTLLKKGKLQLNFHDGSNILVKKEDSENFKPKDTVVVELPERKIKNALKLKKDSIGIIVKGKHSGVIGKISEVSDGNRMRKSLVKLDGIETLTDYVFIIGEKEPVISI